MRNLKLTVAFSYLVILGICLFNFDNTHALSIDSTCTKIEVIFSRGSGSKIADGEAIRFFNEIEHRLSGSNISQRGYELGTEPYGGYQYPAISVSGWGNLTMLGASLSAGEFFAYGDSVKQGVGELNSYLTQRHNKCKSSNTYYILGGYSQGAQVVGQALPGLSREIRDRIVFVGLFGDPKLHLPEGEGWNPPACRGKDFSPWRRAIDNCSLDNGSLSARNPYLPEDMKQKTGLWCYKKDSICDIGALGEMSGHSEYKSDGRAIDEAAREAVAKLAQKPDISGDSVDTKPAKNSGTTGTDIAFVIDVTGSMYGDIIDVKEYIRQTVEKLKSQDTRFAIVTFGDAGYGQIPTVISAFEDDTSTLLSNLGYIQAVGGGDIPESALSGLMTAFNKLSWKDGAAKAAVLFTDAGFHTPDRYDGSTIESVAKRSLEIDPVNVYPVIRDSGFMSYQDIADKTAGQLLYINDSVLPAIDTVMKKIDERPVALLKNTEYKAEPNQEITFDASGSHVTGANITGYDWDFDGDSIYDASTTIPTINHTYTQQFNGYIQVRVTTDNDTIASASVPVTVQLTSQNTLPAAPSNLTHTITKTENDKSTVVVSWNSNPATDFWAIGINDTTIGRVQGSQTSLEISNVRRGEDVTIHVAGGKNGVSELGKASTTVVKAATTQPLPVSKCTQSNLFTRIICKAIALLRVFIQGVLYYILPWAM